MDKSTLTQSKTKSKSYRIPVSTSLFSLCKALGPALWLYVWYVDRTTKEVEVDGRIEGLVCGGHPVSDQEPALELGVSNFTVARWRKTLRGKSLISAKRVAGSSHKITILNSQKWPKSSKAGLANPAGQTESNRPNLPAPPEQICSDTPSKSARTSEQICSMRKDFTEQTKQERNNNKQTGKSSVVVRRSDNSADGHKPALDRAAEVFAEATGGRRFGFAGKYLAHWTAIVNEHGEDVALEAVRVWAETLDGRAFDGPNVLRNPAAAFLAHAADEAIAQAKVEIKQRQCEADQAAESKAGRERMYVEAVEKYGAERVARLDDLPKDAPISSVGASRLMFWYGNYWGPLEDAESYQKHKAKLDREIAEKRERERRERIESRTIELLDEKFGYGYSPVSEEDKATYEAARDECEARAIEQVEEEMNANAGN